MRMIPTMQSLAIYEQAGHRECRQPLREQERVVNQLTRLGEAAQNYMTKADNGAILDKCGGMIALIAYIGAIACGIILTIRIDGIHGACISIVTGGFAIKGGDVFYKRTKHIALWGKPLKHSSVWDGASGPGGIEGVIMLSVIASVKFAICMWKKRDYAEQAYQAAAERSAAAQSTLDEMRKEILASLLQDKDKLKTALATLLRAYQQLKDIGGQPQDTLEVRIKVYQKAQQELLALGQPESTPATGVLE